MRRKSELYDFAAEKRHETERAVLLDCGLVDEDNKPAPVWFPKSQLQDNEDGTYTVPEWLAVEKGIV